MINAFLQPILQRAAQGDSHWHNYFALIAQVNNTPAWGGETMARTFDPVIHRLIRALRKALPDASEEDLYWSYHFLSGALTLSLSQTGRIDRLSNGLCKSSDFESIHRRMAPFIASGFERLCKPVAKTSRQLWVGLEPDATRHELVPRRPHLRPEHRRRAAADRESACRLSAW